MKTAVGLDCEEDANQESSVEDSIESDVPSGWCIGEKESVNVMGRWEFKRSGSK